MTITITPQMFDTFVNLIELVIGIDFIWCGLWFLMKNDITHLPKLLGYWALKTVRALHEKANRQITRVIFSIRAMPFYLIFAGLILILDSILTLLSRTY